MQSNAIFEGGGAFDIVSPTLQKVVSSFATMVGHIVWSYTVQNLGFMIKVVRTFDIVYPTL